MMMIMMMTTNNYNDKNKFVEEHLTWQIAKEGICFLTGKYYSKLLCKYFQRFEPLLSLIE